MKYFTKSYIKECDCEEIQELRELKLGDWYYLTIARVLYLADYEFMEHGEGKLIANEIWLPTGDQLDEEIIRKARNTYNVKYKKRGSNLIVMDTECVVNCNANTKIHKNPLLAKILLLKQLLKEGK